MRIARILNELVARRRRRRTTLTLASLSDAQLGELGVTRYDLFDARVHRG